MYEIKIYETPSGNKPFEKHIEKLLRQHKDDEVYEIKAYLSKLEQYGFAINTEFKHDAIKLLREEVYELRPSNQRVFFFYFTNGEFIVLHGYEKKTNKTDPNEIDKAIREKNSILRRK